MTDRDIDRADQRRLQMQGEPNPSTDSPLNAEEWRDRFVVFVETVLDLCASDSRYRSQVADLRLQLRELAREPLAAHPESRPDPGEGLREALDVLDVMIGQQTLTGASYVRDALRAALASPVPTDRPEPCDRLHWTEVVEQSKAADRPEPIDEERLARALITLRGDYPGVQFDAEAIAAAYRTEPGETR